MHNKEFNTLNTCKLQASPI